MFPPDASLRLTKDMIVFGARETPKWNPMNVCSYHLQEAGATPVQELSYALATAIAVLERVRQSGEVDEAGFAEVVGRISFFVNAGMRFVTELAKMRAFVELWDEITHDRFGVQDPSKRRFRYGVQVNSLGLTEQQPENNAYRILIEMLSVVLSKKARARAVQLPAWNEALGLPRPFDQQWSLRLQQIVAYETDLLEFDDIFDGSKEVEALVAKLKSEAKAEIAGIDAMGGAVKAIETGVLKARLVESNTRRLEAIERGEQIVVGVNAFPILSRRRSWRREFDHDPVSRTRRPSKWPCSRRGGRVATRGASARPAGAAFGGGENGNNIMQPRSRRPKPGPQRANGPTRCGRNSAFSRADRRFDTRASGSGGPRPAAQRSRTRLAQARPPDGFRRQAGPRRPFQWRRADRSARLDAGMDVVYDGIPPHPGEIVEAAKSGVHCVGLSILSGSHIALTEEVLELCARPASNTCLLIIGGIVPPADAERLKAAGVATIYTPKDLAINDILAAIVTEVERALTRPWSAGEDRTAVVLGPAIRAWTANPTAKRVEVRFPDPTANPYLASSAMLMAGLDGITNKINPGPAMDKDLHDLPPKELKKIPTVCGTLREALSSLDKDRAFLKAGDVFNDDFIDSYIELKMADVQRFEMTPHPVEFEMYYSY